MINQKSLEELKNKISNSQKIAIFGHDHVDGDCVGAMVGFGTLLSNMGKNITYHTSYPVAKYLQRVPGIEKITTEFDYSDYDLIFVLDMNNISRISKFDISSMHNMYIIDHHPISQDISYLNIIDTSSSSACELIWEYIYEGYLDLISPEIATCLLLGIITDTGRFLYEKDTTRTLNIASQMISKGADKSYILENLKPKYDGNYFKFLRTFVDRIKEEDGIVYSYILQSDLGDLGVGNIDDAGNFREYIMNYEGVRLSIYITLSENNNLKFSMRSTEGIAGPIARYFGGGGHPNAGSFNVLLQDGQDVHELISQTISDIKSFYKIL